MSIVGFCSRWFLWMNLHYTKVFTKTMFWASPVCIKSSFSMLCVCIVCVALHHTGHRTHPATIHIIILSTSTQHSTAQHSTALLCFAWSLIWVSSGCSAPSPWLLTVLISSADQDTGGSILGFSDLLFKRIFQNSMDPKLYCFYGKIFSSKIKKDLIQYFLLRILFHAIEQTSLGLI